MKVSKPEMTKSTHLPFGVPYSNDEVSSLNLLYNEEYITAYSLKYKMPLWTAFTLKEQVLLLLMNLSIIFVIVLHCFQQINVSVSCVIFIYKICA